LRPEAVLAVPGEFDEWLAADVRDVAGLVARRAALLLGVAVARAALESRVVLGAALAALFGAALLVGPWTAPFLVAAFLAVVAFFGDGLFCRALGGC
jgi:hypothetical protein